LYIYFTLYFPEDIQTITDFARERWGCSGDGDLAMMQSRVSMLVSMVDREACFPVYTYLTSQLQIADVLSAEECKYLYPDGRKKEELEYLPECRSIGLTEEDLLTTTRAGQKLPVSKMTCGVMTEILRYVEKYYLGKEKDRFYEIVNSIFQITKMIDSEKHTMRMRVRRDMEKMKKNKQTKQLEDMKKEEFDLPESQPGACEDSLVDQLRSLNIKVSPGGIPAELRGMVESLTNSFFLVQDDAKKLLDRNTQLEAEQSMSQQRESRMTTQHQEEMAKMQTRLNLNLNLKSGNLKAARRLKDHYKEQVRKARATTGKFKAH